MFRMSKMSDYGLRLVLTLSRRYAEDENYSARDLSRITGLPRPVSSKILKILAREGLLSSARGVNGGYRLARAPEKISVGQILKALEGPILIKGCLEEDSGCGNFDNCTIRFNWDRINRAVTQVLDSVSLPDLMSPLNEGGYLEIGRADGSELSCTGCVEAVRIDDV